MALALPLRPTSTQPRAYHLTQPYHNGTWYNRSPHHALDMVGYAWQPVYAAQSGRVFAAEWNGRGWAIGGGYSILIEHWGLGKFARTSYAHLARVVVTRGQWVMRGQLIGYADSTGNSTGHHLHFAVGVVKGGEHPAYYYSYKWMDPRRFFQAHRFANGSQGNGDLVSAAALRNTFRVNAGVNIRSGRYLSSGLVRRTTAATNVAFVARVRGTHWNGTSTWYKCYDPIKRLYPVYVHSTLGSLS